MSTDRADTRPEPRTSLTRARVLAAAVDLADRDGLDALSMRKLGQDLGIEAMSLYTHVRNKDDLLDGMLDAIVREITVARTGPDWNAALRQTVMAARTIVLRHPWAPPVIVTRTQPGPVMLGYLDAVMGILRDGGFSVAVTHHALHILGSRILGFTQDLYDDSPDLDPAAAAILAEQVAGRFPHVAEMAMAVTHDGGLGGCDDDVEFAIGLDLILDGLERLRDA